jgi:hypothetical protein
MEQHALPLEDSVLTETTETVNESTGSETNETLNLSPQQRLEILLSKRTGDHEVAISYDDLKYIKNSLVQKIEWTGSNEAYLLIITVLSINSQLDFMNPKSKERIKITLSASVLESINYFLSKISGKGIDSAQKHFSAAMQLRPALEELKKLDEEIQSLKKEING